MSCVESFAIMPSPTAISISTANSTSSSHSYHHHHPSTSQHPSMAYNRPPYQNYGRQPQHQNTWPMLSTQMTPLVIGGGPSIGGGGPPSANPFSPTPHTHNARNVSEIIPGLYISDLAFAENPSLLSSFRITHILSTLPDTIYCPPPTLLPFQPTRLQIRVEDMPFAELAGHLPSTTAFIANALANPDARVLVHCGEGISRSVSVVAAFLMAQYNWTPMEAVGFVKSKRRIAEPNPGFIQQLHEYARDGLGRANVGNPAHPASAPGYGYGS